MKFTLHMLVILSCNFLMKTEVTIVKYVFLLEIKLMGKTSFTVKITNCCNPVCT